MPPHGDRMPAPLTESAKEARKAFYCELCSKGYGRINDFEAHESSYDHLHKKRLKEMKQLSKDPSSRTRALKAEARANEKSGASVSAITIKPISGAGGSGGGFKKGGFKSAFKPASDEDAAAATQPELVREKSASETAMTGKVLIGEGDADKESASESEAGEGMYDPHQPTGCWAGCPAYDLNTTILSSSTRASQQSFEEYWCENDAGDFEFGPGLGQDSDSFDPVPIFFGLNDTEKSLCMSLQKANYSSWLLETQTTSSWRPAMTTPCCNKPCHVGIEEAQLLLWPTPAPVPNATTIVNDEGFTFTSPSVYIIYKNIAATGLWGCGTLSPSFTRLTHGYAASDISTIVSQIEPRPNAPNGPEQILNTADLFSNCTSISYHPSTYNKHCYPIIVYPHGLHDVDPAWKSCTDSGKRGNHLAVFDPPRVLTPASALGPATTEGSASLSVTTAAPAPTLPTPSVTKTDTPMALASPSHSDFDPQQQSSIKVDPIPASIAETQAVNAASNSSPVSKTTGSEPASGSNARGSPLARTLSSVVTKPQRPSYSSNTSAPPKISVIDSVSTLTSRTPDSRSPISTTAVSITSTDEARGKDDPTVQLAALGPLALMTFSAIGLHNSVPPDPKQTSNPAQPTKGTSQELSGLQLVYSRQSGVLDDSPTQAISLPIKPSEVSFAVIDQGGLSLAGTVHRSGPVMIAGSTMKAGATAIPIQGHWVSVDPAASKIIIDGETLAIPSLSADTKGRMVGPQANPSAISTAGQVEPSNVISINRQAITRGDGPVTISNAPVGFDANRNLIVGTSTIREFDRHLSQDQLPVITVGSLTLTIGGANRAKDIDDAPTSKGRHAITESGTTVSYVDGSLLPGATITAAGQTLTISPSDVAINGTSLAVNEQPITIAGIPVSLGIDGSVVGTSTIPISSLAPNADIAITVQSYITVSPLPSIVGMTVSNTSAETTKLGNGSTRGNKETTESKSDGAPEPTSTALLSGGNGGLSTSVEPSLHLPTSTSGTTGIILPDKTPVLLVLLLFLSCFILV